ncbi:MAG: phenylalanine--tRNA ligase subunit beta [Candidatus Woesearchaeota archaeon]
MPTVTFTKKRVLEGIGDLSDSDLADRISMLGTDLERITTDEIIVEIFPNRTDMLSEQGFIHALKNFIERGDGYEDVHAHESEYEIDVDPKMTDVRPYTVAAVARGVHLDDASLTALIQLQEKLHISYLRKRAKGAIGIYPMEHIEWPIRYTARRADDIVFTPLGSERMSAREMLEKHSAGQTYGHLLKGRPLYPLFVDAKDNVLSVPPIINSEETGRLTTKTTDVFIETSGSHLPTLERALAIIAFNLQKLGAQIHAVTVRYPDQDVVTPRTEPQRIPITPKQASKILGHEPDAEAFVELLARMGHGYDEGHALVATYRTDILHPIDIIEDLIIAYGYENVESDLPDISTTAHEDGFETFKRKIAYLLTGFGYHETHTYHLIPKSAQETVGLAPIELANPMNREYDTLRMSVLISLLDVLSRNRNAAMPRRVYEIGRVFHRGESETGIVEHDELAVALEDDQATFSTAQQVVDTILSRYGLEYSFTNENEWDHTMLLEGRRSHVTCQGTVIGEIGDVHPDVLHELEIHHAVIAVTLNLEAIHQLIQRR